MPLFAFALLAFTMSCQEQVTTKEKTEITTMDSTAQRAKEAADKLDEQTKKVEASIEKMDEEFKINN